MKPISLTAFYCCGVRMRDAESDKPVCGDVYAKTGPYRRRQRQSGSDLLEQRLRARSLVFDGRKIYGVRIEKSAEVSVEDITTHFGDRLCHLRI